MLKDSTAPSFLLPPEESDAPPAIGHIPLLWILAPQVPMLALCFAFDLRAPQIGFALLFLAGIPAIFLKNKPRLWAICQVIAGTGFALAFFAARVPPLPNWENLPPREAELTLRWQTRFAERPDAKTISGIARVIDAPRQVRELIGTDVYCQMRKPVSEIAGTRGATFRAVGVVDTCRRNFETLADADGFIRYLEYRRANMAFSRGRLLEIVADPPAIYRQSAALHARMENSLRRGLENSPAAADLLTAALLGDKKALSTETLTTFRRTGTMHLFAVSGLHIGVIAGGLFWFLKRIRIADPIVRLLVIAILFAFVVAVGMPASAVRAWFMVACMLGAGFIARKSNPAAGLALAATIVVILDPRTLLDIGFQLSYGVVAAILLYGMPLAKYVNTRWQPWRDLPVGSHGIFRRAGIYVKERLVDSFGISLAAAIASTPLVVAHFQIFSAGGIFINVFIVPLAFPVMLAGFASLLLGVVGLGYFAIPLNLLSGFLINLIAGIVHLVSEIPGMAHATTFHARWIGIICAFVLLAVFLAMNSGKHAPRPAWFLVPPAIVILTLIFG